MSVVIIDYLNETPYTEGKELFLEKASQTSIKVCEYFSQTIQGEGKWTGYPASFIRLSGCHLNCEFCDSVSIWNKSKHIEIDNLISLMKECGDFERLQNSNYHLIITGGSPLLQQERVYEFICALYDKLGFRPFIEVETEGSIKPEYALEYMVNWWNVSPKLSNSFVREDVRYKPDVLKYHSQLKNTTFKFVISDTEKDWNEIYEKYINKGLVKLEQIVLMPEGINREQLSNKREAVAQLAIDKGVVFSDREHIILYNDKKSV